MKNCKIHSIRRQAGHRLVPMLWRIKKMPWPCHEFSLDSYVRQKPYGFKLEKNP
jgi:hypothetical protein